MVKGEIDMKKWRVAASGLVAFSVLASPYMANAAQGPVSITLLQNKPEVVSEWNKLISEFEKSNPGITVKQIQPPNIDTTLQADVAKGQVPDLVAMGADATFVQMAQNGIFKNLSGAPELKQVSAAYTKMLENEVGKPTPYGIPYTINAVPVLYNVQLFKKYHLTVPKTFNQLIADAKKVKSQGGTPFYNGWKDSWTIAPPWNALATNSEPANFQHQLIAGTANFTKVDGTAVKDLKILASYGQASQFGTDYNDANTGFANGKGVFYLQGTWVLPVLRAANPKIQVGSFVFPATNNPNKTKMVSGIDSLIAVANSGNSAKEAAAMKFIDFLLQKKNAAEYAQIAGTFSTVKGTKSTDKAIAGLQTYINKGRVVDFDDHYYPPAMAAGNQYESLFQGALSKKQSVSSILSQLQSMYQSSRAHE